MKMQEDGIITTHLSADVIVMTKDAFESLLSQNSEANIAHEAVVGILHVCSPSTPGQGMQRSPARNLNQQGL
jgi:hypothetical protein